MPNLASIRQALAAGITVNAANPAPLKLLKQTRRRFRTSGNIISDTDEAWTALLGPANAWASESEFAEAVLLIVANLGTMQWTGAHGIRALRNRIREILADQTASPQVRDLAEQFKRTLLIDQDAQGAPTYDQQNTDPIVAACDAALVVLSTSTDIAAIQSARQVLDRFVDITPGL